MLASSRPPLRARNSLASWSRLWPWRRDSHWAIRFQCPGGVSDPGPSDQYTAMLFLRSLRPALSWRRLSAVCDTDLGGVGTWVSGMVLGLNGVTWRQCGVLARHAGLWLPAPGVDQRGRRRRVDRGVAAGVGVATGLVGAVVGAVGDHRIGRRPPHSGGGGGVAGAVAEGLQLGVPVGLAARPHPGRGPVGGVADRLVLVGQGPLRRGTPQGAAESGPDRLGVIGRPGVVGGAVDDEQGPGVDLGRGPERPDALQGLVVPLQHHVVAVGGREAGQRVGGRRVVVIVVGAPRLARAAPATPAARPR